LATEVCPKGRKHIGGGEAPVYEKYQIHSPNGAAEIEESLCPVRLRFWEHILSSVRRIGYPEYSTISTTDMTRNIYGNNNKFLSPLRG